MKILKHEKGQALVEFTIVLIPLLMLLLGMLYGGAIYNAMNAADLSAGNAAKEAALYIPNGGYSCYRLAILGRGNPVFFMMENQQFYVSDNCKDDSSLPALAPRSMVTATWEFDFVSRIPFIPLSHHFVITKEAYVH